MFPISTTVVLRYTLNRLLGAAVILLLTSLITFSLLRLAPGDPVDILFGQLAATAGRQVPAEMRAQIRAELGLDQPYAVQYLRWLGRVVQLDFGASFRSHRPVAEELGSRLLATLSLTSLALLIQVVLTVVFGILSALRPNSWFDHATRLGSIAFVALPNFWLGLLLLYLFGVQLHWISISPAANVRQVILPALTLGVGLAPQTVRVLRASLLTEFSRLYVTMARAKGLPEYRLIVRHALPNALLPTITLLGLSVSSLLSGAVIVESVFSWPGIGKYAVDSIYARDYPVIQGYVLIITTLVVLISLMVDVSYTFLDPRIRLAGEETR